MYVFHHRSRWTIVLAVSITTTLYFHFLYLPTSPQDESWVHSGSESNETLDSEVSLDNQSSFEPTVPGPFPKPVYTPGIFDPFHGNSTRSLIVARTSGEDVGWISRTLSDEALLDTVLYTVNDISASNTVPKNKGHEVMVYLTYIIDHYDHLNDVTMFMHAHQITWHNNDLLGSDSAAMVKHLSVARVIREGYMNMRCHLDPGCPSHIHPLTDSEDINVPEAVIIGRAWKELFPSQSVPEVLSQPCCAQLAVSRDRIHVLPKERYIFFRDWLLNSELEDSFTGRIFEYVWQYLWTGAYEFCPEEHICYCDGYGICFGGAVECATYFSLRVEARDLREQTDRLRDKHPEDDRDMSYADPLAKEADEVDRRMAEMKDLAFERGRDPRNRALEAKRSWREGVGY